MDPEEIIKNKGAAYEYSPYLEVVPLSCAKEYMAEFAKVKSEQSHIEGVLIGLNICKEMWAQGTISHENIRENEIMYQEELRNLKLLP